MQHIDEAVLHEYLDRGEADDVLRAAAEHIVECGSCRSRLEAVREERMAASSILRAASPSGMPRPSFESLLPRPVFDTLEGVNPTDIVFAESGPAFKQVSIGMRGQAIGLAWAATIIMALGVGWFASELYREDTGTAARQIADGKRDSVAAPIAVAPRDTLRPAPDVIPSSPSSIVAMSTPNQRVDANEVAGAAARTSPETEPVFTPPAAPAQALALPAEASKIATMQTDLAENVSKPVGGGKAAADRMLSSSDIAGTMNLDAYPDTLTASVVAAVEQWRKIDADSALKILGGQMIRARGLHVIDYAVTGEAGAQRVRVRQRMLGDTLEIYQTGPRAGAPVATASPGALHNVAGGTYFRRFYSTMLAPDHRVVTVVTGKAKSVAAWKPELTSSPRD